MNKFVRKPYKSKDVWKIGPARDMDSGSTFEGTRSEAHKEALRLTKATGTKHSVGWIGHTGHDVAGEILIEGGHYAQD